MKKIALAMIFVGLIIAFNSCAWRVPENITVKSKADYSFSLGTYEKELNTADNMDKDDLMGSSADVYDYFPGRSGATTQHYLLKVLVHTLDIMDKNTFDNLPAGSVSIPSVTGSSGSIPLGFNPSSILSAMTAAFGSSVSNKIKFDSAIPMYLYCKTIDGITASATLNFGTPDPNMSGIQIRNFEMPDFVSDETVYTNLDTFGFLAKTDIKDIINGSSPELNLSYSISSISGSFVKEEVADTVEAMNGVKLLVYAVIDVPLYFSVTDDIEMNLIDMTGGNSSSSGSDSNSSDMTKYTEIIEAVSIKYIAYSLPFYSTSGINLLLDMLGTATDNDGFERAPLSISSTEQQTINLPYSTVRAMRSNLNFHPNIKIKIDDGSRFSVPRDRSVRINVEMHIKTDGKIKVK